MRKDLEPDAFERALQSAFDFVCYYIGRAVIWAGTLGRLKCDPIYVGVRRRKLRECHFRHLRAGESYLTREGTHYVGLLAAAVMVCGAAVYLYFQVGPHAPPPPQNPLPESGLPAPVNTDFTVSTNS